MFPDRIAGYTEARRAKALDDEKSSPMRIAVPARALKLLTPILGNGLFCKN